MTARRIVILALKYTALSIAALVTMSPLIWMASATVRPPERFYDYDFFPPLDDWSLESYRSLFRSINFFAYLLNSVFVAGVTVVAQILLASMGGFALAKYRFAGKKLVMLLMLSTMVIPAEVMLAPQYQIVQALGLMDTTAGLILPTAVSVFGVFLFRQAILGVPDELLQAARIDGCADFTIYWRIALPLVRPMVGAFCLIAFMGSWNSFVWPIIVLHRDEMFTLPIGVSKMIGVYREDYGAMMAGTFLSILPVIALFFALQREFVSGLTSGAVKG